IVTESPGLPHYVARFLGTVEPVMQSAVINSRDRQDVVQSMSAERQLLLERAQKFDRYAWAQAVAWVGARPIPQGDFRAHFLGNDTSCQCFDSRRSAGSVRERLEDVVGIVVQ